MSIEKIIKEIQEKQEKEVFSEMKATHKIEPLVLIAHPKHADAVLLLKNSGVDVVVLWSYNVEEDKLYQVTDPTLRANIIESQRR